MKRRTSWVLDINRESLIIENETSFCDALIPKCENFIFSSKESPLATKKYFAEI